MDATHLTISLLACLPLSLLACGKAATPPDSTTVAAPAPASTAAAAAPEDVAPAPVEPSPDAGAEPATPEPDATAATPSAPPTLLAYGDPAGRIPRLKMLAIAPGSDGLVGIVYGAESLLVVSQPLGAPIRAHELAAPGRDVAWVRPQTVAVIGDTDIVFIDPATGATQARLPSLEEPIRGFGANRAGERFVACDDVQIVVANVSDGAVLATFTDEATSWFACGIDPTGATVAAIDLKGGLTLFDVATQKRLKRVVAVKNAQRWFDEPGGWITLTFHADGTRLEVADSTDTVVAYTLPDLKKAPTTEVAAPDPAAPDAALAAPAGAEETKRALPDGTGFVVVAGGAFSVVARDGSQRVAPSGAQGDLLALHVAGAEVSALFRDGTLMVLADEDGKGVVKSSMKLPIQPGVGAFDANGALMITTVHEYGKPFTCHLLGPDGKSVKEVGPVAGVATEQAHALAPHALAIDGSDVAALCDFDKGEVRRIPRARSTAVDRHNGRYARTVMTSKFNAQDAYQLMDATHTPVGGQATLCQPLPNRPVDIARLALGGNRVAAVCDDSVFTAKADDLGNPVELDLTFPPSTAYLGSLALSDDGMTLGVAAAGRLTVHELGTGKQLASHKIATFRPTNPLLVFAGGAFYVQGLDGRVLRVPASAP